MILIKHLKYRIGTLMMELTPSFFVVMAISPYGLLAQNGTVTAAGVVGHNEKPIFEVQKTTFLNAFKIVNRVGLKVIHGGQLGISLILLFVTLHFLEIINCCGSLMKYKTIKKRWNWDLIS